MAFADAIGGLFAADFEIELHQNNVWLDAALDRSRELRYGDSLRTSFLDTDATVTTVTKANAQSAMLANHTWGDPAIVNETGFDLPIDQYKRINELIPSTVASQIRPSMVRERSAAVARTVRQQMSDDVRAKINASADGTLNLAAIATTSANWNNAAHKTAVLKTFGDARPGT